MIRYLLLALLSALPLHAQLNSAPANFTYTYGTKVEDASGALLASGTITFTPTNAAGAPLGFRIGGGGAALIQPVSTTVTNGAFNLNLVDVNLSSPSYFCYQVTVIDNTTGSQVLGGADYSCIQPNGPNYDLDNYSPSTTPILAPVNAAYNGNFSINGNLYVSGNIYGEVSLQSVQVTNLNAVNGTFTGMLNAAIDNGVVNATLYAGSDLGTQVANAIAAACPSNQQGCTIRIPAGSYTYSTTIFVPPIKNFALIADGAQMTYTGSSYAVQTSPAGNHFFIHGGDWVGTSAALGGLAIGRGEQGCYVEDSRFEQFSTGDGIVNFGCNVWTLLNVTANNDLIGLHPLGSSGYASNAGHVIGSTFNNNQRQGILDGDISQYNANWPGGGGAGVASANFNNLYLGNDVEGNGIASTSGVYYPAVQTGLVVGDVIQGNYCEGTHYVCIEIGETSGSGQNLTTDSAYTRLYGQQANGGNTTGAKVNTNYMTPNGQSPATSPSTEIQLAAAIDTTIDGNNELATGAGIIPATCFINIQPAAVGTYIGHNSVASAQSYFCQGGSPQDPDGFAGAVGYNHIPTDVAIDGREIVFNPTHAVPNSGQPQVYVAPTGAGRTSIQFQPMSPFVGGNTSCNPSWSNGSIYVDTSAGKMYICTPDSTAPAIPSTASNICGFTTPTAGDGNSTWCQIIP